MVWGFLTPQHIITVLLTFIITVAMCTLLNKINDKISDRILFFLSLFGIVGVIGNLVIGFIDGNVLKALPLHLCSYNALLLPIAVKTKNNKLCTTLSVWSIGALIAILLNEDAVEYMIMSPRFLIYFIPHVFEFAVPITLLFLNKFTTRFKDILWAVGFTAMMYTVSYALSEVITASGTNVNYLFGMGSVNFVTDFFYSILPYKYLYMFTTFPIIFILYFMVYIKSYLNFKKEGLFMKKFRLVTTGASPVIKYNSSKRIDDILDFNDILAIEYSCKANGEIISGRVYLKDYGKMDLYDNIKLNTFKALLAHLSPVISNFNSNEENFIKVEFTQRRELTTYMLINRHKRLMTTYINKVGDVPYIGGDIAIYDAGLAEHVSVLTNAFNAELFDARLARQAFAAIDDSNKMYLSLPSNSCKNILNYINVDSNDKLFVLDCLRKQISKEIESLEVATNEE